MNQYNEFYNEYLNKWKYDKQKNQWNVFDELWLMKRKQYFWIYYFKKFHVKYVKNDNKTCLIFNQDEMNPKNEIKSKFQELKTFIWIFILKWIMIFSIIF
jgi:hypothetical protein